MNTRVVKNPISEENHISSAACIMNIDTWIYQKLVTTSHLDLQKNTNKTSTSVHEREQVSGDHDGISIMRIQLIYRLVYILKSADHALTRTTFLFPLPAAPAPATPGAAPSAFIPAFTVSTRTPEGKAGEYMDMRLAGEGKGSGGLGRGRLVCFGGARSLDFGTDAEDLDEMDFGFEDLAAEAVVGGVAGVG